MRLFYKSEKQFIMKQSKLFSLPLLASLLSFSLQAQTPTDNIFYNLDEKTKTAEVTNSADKYSGDISIPEKIILNDTEYTVTSIGKEAFKDCTSLTNIILPNSITKIDEAAFSGCSALTTVTIMSNVIDNIGTLAFNNCSALNTIYIYTETLPTKTAADAFSNVPVTEVILYVPSGMASTYQGADVWKNFGSIIDTPTSIDDIKISDKPWATIVDGGIYIQAEQWEIYNFNGTLLKKGHQPQTVTLQTGLYIIHNLKKGLQKVWIK